MIFSLSLQGTYKYARWKSKFSSPACSIITFLPRNLCRGENFATFVPWVFFYLSFEIVFRWSEFFNLKHERLPITHLLGHLSCVSTFPLLSCWLSDADRGGWMGALAAPRRRSLNYLLPSSVMIIFMQGIFSLPCCFMFKKKWITFSHFIKHNTSKSLREMEVLSLVFFVHLRFLLSE